MVFSIKLNQESATVGADKWFPRENTQPPRIQALSRALEIQKQVNTMFGAKIKRTSRALAYSQAKLTSKVAGIMRLGIDYGRLNIVTAK